MNIDSFKKYNVLEYNEIIERTNYLENGYIAPYYLKTDEFEILPYEKIDKKLRLILLELLNIEFAPIIYNEQYIRFNWNKTDIFYVITKPNQQELIGCIAIYNKNYTPFISNLFIINEYRNKGYSTILLEYAYNFIKMLGFNKVRLWCNDNLIDFYIKKKWIFENKMNDKNIMIYHI